MGKSKLEYNVIKDLFKKEGYDLISPVYYNNKSKLYYKCPNGHEHYITFNNWQTGYRCPYCNGKKLTRHNTLSAVYPELGLEWDYCKNIGVSPSSISYGSHRSVWWKCHNGHSWKSTINNRTAGKNRCPHCYGHIKYTYDFVKRSFEKEGYLLNSTTYLSCDTKLEYLCPHGHIGSISFYNWYKLSQRCPICRHKSFIGQGNPNWKGGVSFEPYDSMWYLPGYKEKIKFRDGYKCQNPACSGNDNVLTIHHIDYNKKNCSEDNLITLCRCCNSKANKNRDHHKHFYNNLLVLKGAH